MNKELSLKRKYRYLSNHKNWTILLILKRKEVKRKSQRKMISAQQLMNKYLKDPKKAISNLNLIYKNPILQFSKIKTQNLIFPSSFHLKRNHFQKIKLINKKCLFKIGRFQMEGINKKVRWIKLNRSEIILWKVQFLRDPKKLSRL